MTLNSLAEVYISDATARRIEMARAGKRPYSDFVHDLIREALTERERLAQLRGAIGVAGDRK